MLPPTSRATPAFASGQRAGTELSLRDELIPLAQNRMKVEYGTFPTKDASTHGLAVLAVSCRVDLPEWSAGRVNIFFVERILSALCVKISMPLLQYS